MIKAKFEVSDEILAHGGFGDVRRGRYHGRPVAVKTARIAPRDDLQKMRKVNINVGHPRHSLDYSAQRFYKEVILWSTLSHPNVLTLIGVKEDIEKKEFIAVSEWMAHGTIMDYIKNNPTNRLELVRSFIFSTTTTANMRR